MSHSAAKAATQNAQNDSRIEGSSFGSKEDKGSSSLPGFGGYPVFQESTYGGLTYQVHVLGEVSKPGTYRVPASTRLAEVLQKAESITERGSQRRIQIRRKEGGTREVDFLSFTMFGNLDANPYLLDNDVVFIPLRQKVVQIAGPVKRPGSYEIKNEKTLKDLVDLGGGFTPGVGNPAMVKIIRFNHGVKEVLEVENVPENREKFEIENADVVVIPHILTEDKKFDYNLANLPGDNALFYPSYEERIFVLGAVGVPGPYPYSPYYGTRQYLTLAGGLTKLAKRRKIVVLTTDGRRIKAKDDTSINPGDSIIVPEKYMAPESLLSLVLGISTSALGITTTVLTLTR
ncbi:MAG: SLBB domain-containing protein [Deltaproteobacteria bacterium]|nr:SLBB domain-containing protein [Deltaproteobacteria bacterium]